MNTTLMRLQLEEQYRKLKNIEIKYKVAQSNETKRQKLKQMLIRSDNIIAHIKSLRTELESLYIVARKEEVAFKKRRLHYMDGNLTERLDYTFPKKNLVAFTDSDFERRSSQMTLYLIDPEQNMRIPYITEGSCAQQLISFSAAESSLRLLNKNILLMDEPFSNASEDNLVKFQGWLNAASLSGFQIIMISQSPLSYQDITRKEIILKSSDGKYVDSVIYYNAVVSEEE